MYRHYRIRSTKDQDDFRSIYEVVNRRAKRGLEECDLPDLMVIDGGKGQLSAAAAALSDNGIEQIDLIGLAKAVANTPDIKAKPERVFILGQKNAIALKSDSAVSFLLMRIRDEAHRVAVTYQRRLRAKSIKHSELDLVAGIGEKRKQALLRKFGSIARLKQADSSAIAAVVGKSLATRIKQYFDRQISAEK